MDKYLELKGIQNQPQSCSSNAHLRTALYFAYIASRLFAFGELPSCCSLRHGEERKIKWLMNVMQIFVDTNLPFVVSSQVPTRQNTQKHTWVGGPVGSLSRGTLKLQDIKILTRLSTVFSSKLCWLRHLRTSLQLGSKPASFCMFMVWAPVSRRTVVEPVQLAGLAHLLGRGGVVVTFLELSTRARCCGMSGGWGC